MANGILWRRPSSTGEEVIRRGALVPAVWGRHHRGDSKHQSMVSCVLQLSVGGLSSFSQLRPLLLGPSIWFGSKYCMSVGGVNKDHDRTAHIARQIIGGKKRAICATQTLLHYGGVLRKTMGAGLRILRDRSVVRFVAMFEGQTQLQSSCSVAHLHLSSQVWVGGCAWVMHILAQAGACLCAHLSSSCPSVYL